MKNILHHVMRPLLLLAAFPVFSQNFNLELRSTMEFPGQTLANICGYTQSGREYALVGASKGLVVVDITDPATPVNIVQIPGPNNLWKEIKVYKNYAYVTSEGGQGLQIVDLSALPSPNLASHFVTAAGQMENAGDFLDKIHALHIDTVKGILYLYGGGLYDGGAKVFDLKDDPYNPKYVGKFDEMGYVHDGFAENDTLYACHINSGFMSIVDMSNKQSPTLLGTVKTPGKFTHNSWLTDDHKHILTTDEEVPSFLTSYDIADPEDIQELDRITPNDGNNSIVHNTHVRNGWAVTSWYTDGLLITDIHRPDNLVFTGWYDTWAGSGAYFDGCWGVYPFFPSGTVIASNIPNTDGGTGKMFVLTPTYTRACYLEGKVTNGCSGQPMNGATIEVNSGNPWVNTRTRINGIYKTGQAEPGNFKVTVSKAGFFSKTLDITLTNGEVTELNVALSPDDVVEVKGVVLTEDTQTPIADAVVTVVEPDGSSYPFQTDVTGQFKLECVESGDYKISAGKWGYFNSNIVISEQTIETGNTIPIYLQPGYYDDFEQDLGWTTSATSFTGLWERADPAGTINQGDLSNPEFDSNVDNNNECYVTGNGDASASIDDIDNGSVTLTSPAMQLAAYQDAVLSFDYWFYNSGGNSTPNDELQVQVSNGSQNVTVFTEKTSQSAWRSSGDIHLKDFIALTDDMHVHFVAADVAPGHLVEAAVDIFKVTPVTVLGTPEIDASARMLVTPNPSSSAFSIRYEWPDARNVLLEVRNLLGQVVWAQQPGDGSGSVVCGDNWPAGVYMATLRSNERQSVPLRLVKQ